MTIREETVKEKALPKGWQEVKLSEVCKIITSPVDKRSVEGELPVKLCNYKDVYYNNVIDSSIVYMTATAKPQEIEKFSLAVDDVIITKDSETPNDIGVPAYVKETMQNLLCGYHLTILRPQKEISGKYISYFLNSQRINYDFYRFANGITRFGLTNESYQKIKILVPPLSEQKAIASLLEKWDTAIEKTEALIAAKQKQFEWLVRILIEQKQYTNKWKKSTLGDLFDIYTHSSKRKFISRDGKLFIVDMGSISRNGDLIANKRTNNNMDVLQIHDLVMPKDDIGGGNIIGKVVIIEEKNKYICSDHVYRLKPKGENNAHFLRFLINSYTINRQLRKKATGTSQLGLSKRDVENQRVWIPSVIEQNIVVQTLNTVKQEVVCLKKLVKAYRIQKLGLMQKLLTNKWRLKI